MAAKAAESSINPWDDLTKTWREGHLNGSTAKPGNVDNRRRSVAAQCIFAPMLSYPEQVKEAR